MAVQRMDNVLIVVEDLDAVIAFFVEIGLELEGKGPLEGTWAEKVIGLENVRQDVAMLRIPGAPGGIELAKFHAPAPITPDPKDAPANTLGMRRVMFAVDDIEDTVTRLRRHGATLVGDLIDFGNRKDGGYRLCYVRGPESIIVGLAEQLG